MKDGFIFYASFQEAIKELPDKTKLLLYNAIADYALDDAEPDFGGNKIACAVFALVKPQIDANARRRDAGTKGGRPNREDQTDARKKPKVTKTKTSGFANGDETKTSGFANDEKIKTNGFAVEKPKEKEKGNVNGKAKANGKANMNEKEKLNAKEKEKENALSFPLGKEREGAVAPCADKPRRSLCPTLGEIKTYCLENGYKIDAQRFYDFYEAKGWRIGSSPMKNWQAAVRTWAGREAEKEKAEAFDTENPFKRMLMEEMAKNG